MKVKDFVVKLDDGSEKVISFRAPIFEDREEADKAYASKIASLIRENSKKKLLLRAEIDDYLRKNNIWTEEDEKNINNLYSEVNALLKKLAKGGIRESEGRKIAIQVMDKRKEILQAMYKRQVFDNATIESVADAERDDYLIYACTVDAETGERFWDSFEDMKLNKDSDAYIKARRESVRFLYNLDPDFEKNLPENKWLKKHGFIDDELNYIDKKTKQKVTKDGKLVSKLEEEIIEESSIFDENGEIIEEAPFIEDEEGETASNIKSE